MKLNQSIEKAFFDNGKTQADGDSTYAEILPSSRQALIDIIKRDIPESSQAGFRFIDAGAGYFTTFVQIAQSFPNASFLGIEYSF